MQTEEEREIGRLMELQTVPNSVKVALYNIALASELESRGQYSSGMECVQEELEKSLQIAYRHGGISLGMCNYLCQCFL